MTEAQAQTLRTERSANRFLFAAVAVLSLVGVVVSAISLQRHYAKSATEFCDFSEKFSCDIVNRSEESAIMGIPVAAIGIVGYGLLFVFATFWKRRRETPTQILAASAAGLAFACYLTYVEAYVLMTWCILCLTSQAVILLIVILAAMVKLRAAQA